MQPNKQKVLTKSFYYLRVTTNWATKYKQQLFFHWNTSTSLSSQKMEAVTSCRLTEHFWSN